jgi:hypothetical protein
MARHHMTSDGPVPFTPDEETDRDAEEQVWTDGEVARNAKAEIRRLEVTVSQRRIREMTTDAGKKWMEDIEAKIAIERGKL